MRPVNFPLGQLPLPIWKLSRFEAAHRWDLRVVLPLFRKWKLDGRMEPQAEGRTQMGSSLK